MKNLSIFILIILNYNYCSACNYTVDLHDTWGDGWNGNTLTIEINGTSILTNITVGTGSDANFTFTANAGDLVTIIYNQIPGSFPDENEITITSDDIGATVYLDGMEGNDPTGGSFTLGNNCGLAPPANNEPCNAINLPVNNVCIPIEGTLIGATLSAIPNPNCDAFTTQSDVWFETTVNASGLIPMPPMLLITDSIAE